MLRIDGSMGEGGGQVIRTALALSIATETPFEIVNIRAGRKKPGLLRQHLAAVRAARELCGARVEGESLGSRRVAFMPGRRLTEATDPVRLEVAIGSGGSAMLVLQTLLPPLLTAPVPATVVVVGGTHNPMAPPYEFFERAFLPWIARIGADVQAHLVRPGFALAGGGRVELHVQPTRALTGFDLRERGALVRRHARAIVSEIPPSVGHRELRQLVRAFDLRRDETTMDELDARGPGNVVLYALEFEHVTEVFSGFGERGLRAETVGDRVVDDVQRYLAAGAPVGRRLADQLLIPLALAGGGSFSTGPLSRHTETNMEVIEAFLPVAFRVDATDKTNLITVTSRANAQNENG